MLAYTLTRLLTMQALIQRDVAGIDGYGAAAGHDWQPHLTVPCRLWWFRGEGIRSAQRLYVDPARLVPVDEGGLLIPLGVDVTEQDRVSGLLDKAGEPYIDGPFTITAVNAQEDHAELMVLRTQMGA
jgi:hypothetical protein